MPNPFALATLAIGAAYQSIFRVTAPSMKRYARKLSADFVLLEEGGAAIPHFAKLRLRELLKSYERVLFLDVDTLVRKDCPNLFDLVPRDHFGLYDEHLLATPAEKLIHHDVMLKACNAYGHAKFKFSNFYNTGVIVASRGHEAVFDRPAQEIVLPYWEQPYLNLLIRSTGIRVFDIGYRFNRMPYLDNRVEHRSECFIIHYAGIQGNMTKIISADLEVWENT
jgi:lipopolysaccharide biosynthesis glycosyltransferase